MAPLLALLALSPLLGVGALLERLLARVAPDSVRGERRGAGVILSELPEGPPEPLETSASGIGRRLSGAGAGRGGCPRSAARPRVG